MSTSMQFENVMNNSHQMSVIVMHPSQKLLDFFENRSYTNPVVDVLVQVTCDALHVNLNILQNHNGHTQMLCNSGGKPCKDIYLKFTHNNLYSQGNHYDSIVNGQKLHTNNLELLSEVAVNELPKSKEMTQVHQPDIPICNDDQEVIILYEDEDFFDIIPPLKKRTTSPQMQSSSQQNCTSCQKYLHLKMNLNILPK